MKTEAILERVKYYTNAIDAIQSHRPAFSRITPVQEEELNKLKGEMRAFIGLSIGDGLEIYDFVTLCIKVNELMNKK